MADIFDVIADSTRRDILQLLLRGGSELSVGEIVAELGLTQPTVSKHLKVLRDHGLVSVREAGQHHFYSLDASPFGSLEKWLDPFVGVSSSESKAESTPGRVVSAISSLPSSDAGAKIGRVVAESTHKVRGVIEDAREQATHAIYTLIGR